MEELKAHVSTEVNMGLSKKLTPYGLLLTFDGYGAPAEFCFSIERLYRVLSELPSLLGMRALGTPHIVEVTEKGIAGLSGFTFIMESHISIHTYIEKGFVTVDIYSCKEFDTTGAIEYLTNNFLTESHEIHTIVRGIRFNEDTRYESLKKPRPHMRP
jgi:S-adenosylmethionine decarboxylase